MPQSENDPRRRGGDVPTGGVPLPKELAAYLRGADLGALLYGSDQGSVYLIKAPGREIATLRGTFPIRLAHELYDHPAAPVIRSLLTLYDEPDRPLALESFINVADPEQRADFARLAEQERILLLFYDERLRHRLSKRIPNPTAPQIPTILAEAERLAQGIQPDRFDFDQAKADVLQVTTL